MAKKVYLTQRLNLAIAWDKPFNGFPGKTKNVTLNFEGGRLETDDEAEQKYIESLPTFKDETIYIETTAYVIANAERKTKALRSIADDAVKAAQAAEAALAEMKKAAAKPAPAAA